jgi:hypothetical protein
MWYKSSKSTRKAKTRAVQQIKSIELTRVHPTGWLLHGQGWFRFSLADADGQLDCRIWLHERDTVVLADAPQNLVESRQHRRSLGQTLEFALLVAGVRLRGNQLDVGIDPELRAVDLVENSHHLVDAVFDLVVQLVGAGYCDGEDDVRSLRSVRGLEVHREVLGDDEGDVVLPPLQLIGAEDQRKKNFAGDHGVVGVDVLRVLAGECRE